MHEFKIICHAWSACVENPYSSRIWRYSSKAICRCNPEGEDKTEINMKKKLALITNVSLDCNSRVCTRSWFPRSHCDIPNIYILYSAFPSIFMHISRSRLLISRGSGTCVTLEIWSGRERERERWNSCQKLLFRREREMKPLSARRETCYMHHLKFFELCIYRWASGLYF